MKVRKYLSYKFAKRPANTDIEIGNLLGIVIALSLVGASVIYIGTTLGFIPTLSTVGTTTPSAQSCLSGYIAPPGFLCTQLPLKATLNDPLPTSSNAIGSATIAIYDPLTLAVKESVTTASDGTVNTANPFITGQKFVAKITATNYVTTFEEFVVPAVAQSAAQVTTNGVPFYAIYLNTWSLTAAVAPGGSTWTSTFSTYSYANTALNQIVVTFTVSAVTNNRGYQSHYDIVNKLNRLFVAEFADGASASTTVDGCQFKGKVGTTTYCQFILPDGITTINPSYTLQSNAITTLWPKDATGRYQASSPVSQSLTTNGITVTGALTSQLQGNVLTGGTVSFPITFNKGSLGAGSSMTWTVKLFYYSDVVRFHSSAENGSYGPDSTQTTTPGTLSITLKN